MPFYSHVLFYYIDTTGIVTGIMQKTLTEILENGSVIRKVLHTEQEKDYERKDNTL